MCKGLSRRMPEHSWCTTLCIASLSRQMSVARFAVPRCSRVKRTKRLHSLQSFLTILMPLRCSRQSLSTPPSVPSVAVPLYSSLSVVPQWNGLTHCCVLSVHSMNHPTFLISTSPPPLSVLVYLELFIVPSLPLDYV